MNKLLWLRSPQIVLQTVLWLLVVACRPVPPTGTPVALDGTPTLPQETPASAPTEIGSWPFSPDQHLMVAQTHDGAWWMWDVSSRKPVYLLNNTARHAPPMHHPIFSPDGHYLAALSIGHVLLWEVATHKRRVLTSPIPMDVRSLRRLVFSPNSHLLATNGCEQQNSHMVCDGGFVNLWNTADGTLVRTLPVGFRADEMVFSTDSTTFTVSGCSRNDGVIGSYCYEESKATFQLDNGQLIALTRVPQFK